MNELDLMALDEVDRKPKHMGDNLLLVEDDPAEAQALIRALADPRAGSCTVEWVTLLDAGLQRLKSGGISIILLPLFVRQPGR